MKPEAEQNWFYEVRGLTEVGLQGLWPYRTTGKPACVRPPASKNSGLAEP